MVKIPVQVVLKDGRRTFIRIREWSEIGVVLLDKVPDLTKYEIDRRTQVIREV